MSFLTSYEKIEDCEDEIFIKNNARKVESNFGAVIESIFVTAPKLEKKRWTHIKNLDEFLQKVYDYHQMEGFRSILLEKIGNFTTVLFTCVFTIFLCIGIDYDIVFKEKLPPGFDDTTKVKISDCIVNVQDVEFGYISIAFIFISCAYIVYTICQGIKEIILFSDTWYFYNEAMGIKDKRLHNYTWQQVEDCIKKAQTEHRMCVNTKFFTELDIYQRILRFENFFVAMVHKNVICPKLNLPFLGEIAFLPRGLKFILKYLLFDCSFENGQLKEKYKCFENRQKLAKLLKKRFFWYGLFGLVISPVVLIMQILESVYRYTSFIKVDPTIFTIRMWSNYGKVALRHYNELDHEQQIRLSRGYKFASEYMKSFRPNFVAKIAKPLSYITGGISAYMMLLGIYDEDVIEIQHFLTISLVLLFLTIVLISTLPNENFSTPPEILMTQILSEIHYLPASWEGKAHTSSVRKEFSSYFQYTFSHFIEALVSPIVTPLILIFTTRAKCLEIIDFLRNFAVAVPCVGDVCYYSLMNIDRHGSHTSHPVNNIGSSSIPLYSPPNAIDIQKLEKSLLNFSLNNPRWEPPPCSSTFLSTVMKQSFIHSVNESSVIQASSYNSSFSKVEENDGGIALQILPNSSTLHQHTRRSRTENLSVSRGSSSFEGLKVNRNFNVSQERAAHNMRVSMLYLQHIHKSQCPIVYGSSANVLSCTKMSSAQFNFANSFYPIYDPPSVHESELELL